MINEKVSKWDRGLLKAMKQFTELDQETQEKALLKLSAYQKANLSGCIERVIKAVEEVRHYEQKQLEIKKMKTKAKEDEKRERIHKRKRVED